MSVNDHIVTMTLKMMDDAELLSWAKAFRGLVGTSTIAKTETLSAPLGDYPPVSVEKFVLYGYQRWHNDGTGGRDSDNKPITPADQVLAAKKKFAQAKAGVVGRTRSAPVDPFMTIVLRCVKAAVKAKNADNYKKIMKDNEKPDAVFMAIFEKHRDGNTPQYAKIMAEATAERQSQERKAAFLAESVDLADTSDL